MKKPTTISARKGPKIGVFGVFFMLCVFDVNENWIGAMSG